MRPLSTLLVCLLLSARLLPGEENPTPRPSPPETPPAPTEPTPAFAAFPGFWFDFLPDVVAADTAFELKFRLGLATQPTVTAQFFAADNTELKQTKIPNPTSADDFAHGRLAVLTLPVEPDPKLYRLRLTAGDLHCTIHLREPADVQQDLRLATLPDRDRPATADHLVALAQATATPAASPAASQAPPPLTPQTPAANIPAGSTWATLGAHLATDHGDPVILRDPERPIAADRSGLITGALRPAANAALPPAKHLLLIAPQPLFNTLKTIHTWTATTELAVQPLTQAPLAAGQQPSVDLAPTSARLVSYPAATQATPFHPFAAVLCATLAQLDRAPPTPDRLIVILPWDDPAFGTDPREYALALDFLAEHYRLQRKAADRPLTELLILGPFRHPSVPEKRHTMLESKVAERQQAQGFSWPDLPALNNPAQWRINPATEPLAVYGTAPALAGLDRLQERLKPLLDQP